MTLGNVRTPTDSNVSVQGTLAGATTGVPPVGPPRSIRESPGSSGRGKRERVKKKPSALKLCFVSAVFLSKHHLASPDLLSPESDENSEGVPSLPAHGGVGVEEGLPHLAHDGREGRPQRVPRPALDGDAQEAGPLPAEVGCARVS